MARPATVGRISTAPCGKTIWGTSMTTDNPLISIYMPTWNRQQLAIRAIKSVLRQDYRHWEMIIVDDCVGGQSILDSDRVVLKFP